MQHFVYVQICLTNNTCVWIVSPVAAKNIDACFCPSFRQFLVKDGVQREITGVESGINR